MRGFMGKISSGEKFLLFQNPAMEEPKTIKKKNSFIVVMQFKTNRFNFTKIPHPPLLLHPSRHTRWLSIDPEHWHLSREFEHSARSTEGHKTVVAENLADKCRLSVQKYWLFLT